MKNQVQTDNLGGLALFLEYGELAKEMEDGGGGREVEARPFQRMEFLIRDWQNWEHSDDPVLAPLRTIHREVRTPYD